MAAVWLCMKWDASSQCSIEIACSFEYHNFSSYLFINKINNGETEIGRPVNSVDDSSALSAVVCDSN